MSIHSLAIPLSRFQTAHAQLKTYITRFKSRLKPIHVLHVQQALVVLSGIIKACDIWAATGAGNKGPTGKKEELFKTNDLAGMLKDGADQVNLVALVGYLKESHLARKISGYAEKVAIKAATKGELHAVLQVDRDGEQGGQD